MATEQHHHDREKQVTVKKVQNEVEASIIKGLLEASGIQCALVTPVPRNVYPFTIDGLAEIRINVLETDAEAARTILDDFGREGLQPDVPDDD